MRQRKHSVYLGEGLVTPEPGKKITTRNQKRQATTVHYPFGIGIWKGVWETHGKSRVGRIYILGLGLIVHFGQRLVPPLHKASATRNGWLVERALY
jgi:hypothetical protein